MVKMGPSSSGFATHFLSLLYSLTSDSPFEGAEANLRKLLDKNEKEYERFVRKVGRDGHLELLSAEQETDRCLVFFLKMVDTFIYGEGGKIASAQILTQVIKDTIAKLAYQLFSRSFANEPCRACSIVCTCP